MNLDADRLAKLAGLPVAKKRNLNEASNRSMHDDASLSGEDEHRFGKGQLAERGESHGDKSDTRPGEKDYTWKAGDKSKTDKGTRDRGERAGDEAGPELEEDTDYSGHGMRRGDQSDTRKGRSDFMGETIEVNEKMISREIALMRKERLQENELRKIIRAEIGSIMKGIKKESTSGTKRKASRRSSNLKKGVTLGMLGPGFR